MLDPQRLVIVSTGQRDLESFNYLMFDRIRRLNQFDGVLAWSLPGPATLTYASDTQPVERFYVSGDYFSTLGVHAIRGRTLTAEDDVAGGGPSGLVAVMSYGYWQTRFAGSPDVVGARMVIGRTPVTIIGVTPPEFFGLMVGRAFEIAPPIRGQPIVQPGTPLTDDLFWLRIGLRLKPGQSVDAATNVLRAAQPAIRVAALPGGVQNASSFLKDPFSLVLLGSIGSPLRRRFQQPLIVLLAVVALVTPSLRIASSRPLSGFFGVLAMLLAAIGLYGVTSYAVAQRRTEIGIRMALGAAPGAVIRLVVSRVGLLILAGVIIGMTVCAWTSTIIQSLLYDPEPRDPLTLLGATLILSVIGALAGALPAWRASRIDPADALRSS